jgi:hypothetical protein
MTVFISNLGLTATTAYIPIVFLQNSRIAEVAKLTPAEKQT